MECGRGNLRHGRYKRKDFAILLTPFAWKEELKKSHKSEGEGRTEGSVSQQSVHCHIFRQSVVLVPVHQEDPGM